MREMLRMVYRENREQNLNRVAESVRSAKAYVTSVLAECVHEHIDTPTSVVTKLHRQEKMRLCARVLARLAETITGLEHLSETYRSDASTLSRIENIKADVQCFLTTTHVVERDATPSTRLTQ